MNLRFPGAFIVLVGGAALFASLTIEPGTSSADSAVPARASAAPDAGVALPPFDAEPWGEASTLPTAAEWKPTTPVALTDPLPFDCHAYRVREWVKIRCSHLMTSTLALLGGSREGVLLFIDPPPENDMAHGGEVVFAVRRGDRRVVEWSTFGESYEGPGSPEVAFLISESWAPGDAAPAVIAAQKP